MFKEVWYRVTCERKFSVPQTFEGLQSLTGFECIRARFSSFRRRHVVERNFPSRGEKFSGSISESKMGQEESLRHSIWAQHGFNCLYGRGRTSHCHNAKCFCVSSRWKLEFLVKIEIFLRRSVMQSWKSSIQQAALAERKNIFATISAHAGVARNKNFAIAWWRREAAEAPSRWIRFRGFSRNISFYRLRETNKC